MSPRAPDKNWRIGYLTLSFWLNWVIKNLFCIIYLWSPLNPNFNWVFHPPQPECFGSFSYMFIVENNENLFNKKMNYLKGLVHLLVYTWIPIYMITCYIWTSRWNVVSLTLAPCRTFHQISPFLLHVKMLIPYQK